MRRTLRLLVLPVLLATGCGDDSAPDADAAAPERSGVRITTTEAALQSVRVEESTIGRLASTTAPALTAEVAGPILAVHAEEGDEVEPGDLLLEIEPERYELRLDQARTDVARLDVALETQRRELARNSELLEDGYVTQSRFDATRSEVESLEEDRKAARARVRDAERDLRNTRVTAPVAGAIDQRHVSEGDYAATGQALFRLVSQDLLRVRLPFPEQVAQRIQQGQPVTLTAPVAGTQVDSRISELRPGLDERSGVFEAIVRVTNPGGWRRGGTVNATVTVSERESVVLPAAAVVQRPAGEVAFAIEEGHARERRVEIGQRRGDTIEILDGVAPGTTVAVDGAGFLTDGAAVRTGEE